MKNRYLIITTALLIFCWGCDKDFEQLNVDPNSVSADIIQFEKVFSTVELYSAGNSDGHAFDAERGNMIYSGCIIQHWATNGYSYGDKYNYHEEYITANWVAMYPDAIKHIVDVVENTRDKENKKNLYNIARIFKVYLFQFLTDLYGDLPYSEAGKAYKGGILFPKYDKQEDIYADMLKELDEAATALDASAANTLGDQDIIYGGDVTKWKKFAYSEMARLAMRMSKVAPDKAEQWVQKAVAGGIMTSNDDNAIVEHFAVADAVVSNNGTGWELVSEEAGQFKMSKTFIDFFKSHNDPRLHFYATVSPDPGALWNTPDFNFGDTTSSIQIGMPNGYDYEGGLVPITTAPNFPGDVNKYSITNRYTFARADAPTFYLTAAETQLLLAEAAQRGWISGDAQDIYDNAVTLAFTQLIQSGANWTEAQAEAAANAYLAQNPYKAATGLRQINEQYWVTVFMDEYEAFANWRRSGYPVLTPVNYPNPSINQTGGVIPRRLTYPQSEAAINTEHYNEAVSRLSNGNTMLSRVWWDKP
jgi:hypothetical protein